MNFIILTISWAIALNGVQYICISVVDNTLGNIALS